MINVGIIGFGTVGAGTVRILLKNRDLLKERIGFEINLKKIADLDITRDRGISISPDILTANADDILNDPQIDIVVELIGGIRPAKDFILKAIQNHKHVVTANKALLATAAPSDNISPLSVRPLHFPDHQAKDQCNAHYSNCKIDPQLSWGDSHRTREAEETGQTRGWEPGQDYPNSGF